MKIKQCNTKTLKKTLVAAIGKAYMLAGYRVTDSELANMTDLALETIRKYFGNNEVADIATALEKGALGEYGDYAGISVKTLCDWLRAYNGTATNQQPLVEDEESASAEGRDTEQDGRDLVNACYTSFLAGQPVIVPGSVLLRILRHNGVEITDEQALSAKRRAEAALKADFYSQRSKYKYQRLADVIGDNLAGDTDTLIVNDHFAECRNKNLKTIF